jgi:valyl-tRNA synthetase
MKEEKQKDTTEDITLATKMPAAYSAAEVEQRIYKIWENSGYFNPDNLPLAEDAETYTIIMPPPNANAPMHVGHALGITVEDILIRYNRMRGKRTLWLPGTDHAGFETQVVFEKKLEKEDRSRFKMQRDEFYREIFDFVQSNKHITENGIRRLGASCDWSRNIFTLDPRIVKVVYRTFQNLHNDGLLYRGNRIGNWCVKHQTALSDLETKHEDREDTLYYLKYGPFAIATARPETKFGDKYVVMHPADKRYSQYHDGQQIELEWINGPVTATIIKDEVIDMSFGTGVMTITPWHDAVDFEIAQRHNLESEQVIDKFGKLLPIAEEFAGMKIAAARPLIVEKLRAKGLVEREEKYSHAVQLCYKCGSIIEPQIIPQWFVAMSKTPSSGGTSLRDTAVEAVIGGKVTFNPERHGKVFMHWMENLRDWPISRQIWWGIPIPVKYCEEHNHVIIDIEDEITSCPECGSEKLIRDPDTFDTWFSSGQWPYATLMAHSEKDFMKYYPTTVMETGWDILFFWVARMIMFGLYRTGEIPFSTVFLHGLVRDKDRQKMSKSKGNVIDPLGVIDQYGCDALRFALIFSTAAGNDIPLSEDKIKGMKNFANKLWNIARYVLNNVDNSELFTVTSEKELRGKLSGTLSADDERILSELEAVINVATEHIEALRLHEAAQEIYQFVWHAFADVYIEISKNQLKTQQNQENTKLILAYVLATIVKLLHPFMPFITEEIWSLLSESNSGKKLLMLELWPK